MASTANRGRFTKQSPRFVEKGFWRSMVVHALTYNRESRMWHTACNSFGTFPKGYWMPAGANQPEVTCKDCLKP